MENVKLFGKLTNRMQAFREEVLEENRILTLTALFMQQKLIKNIKNSRES